MVRVTPHFFNAYRTTFDYPRKNLLQWFPGHMGKGLKQMNKNLKSVDCIVEVHDARIPLSGRNKHFKDILGGIKPHILILNKIDLADLTHEKEILSALQKEGTNNVLFTNCKSNNFSRLKKLVPMATDLILNSERYHRSDNKEYSIMITGVPNVGKSSIINALRHTYLRRNKAAPVGALAGVTRSVTSKIKVSEVPLIYVLDTPGILEPTVSDMDAALKLALCSSMQDHLVGCEIIADYLLFWLNKHNNFSYVGYMGVKEPVDSITELLVSCAVNYNKTIKLKSVESGGYTIRPNTEFAAYHFIKGFRTGLFGKVILDKDLINF
ncbi:mitochondrial GTPase 1 [Halyomorpha halys]|uniref:mitochondrial GTPase 1 n=1 Tax=Halyomorpha halys TaxID=286706 RepID=UPI0006D4E1E9|nr:mitochondrial GTPase 1 [Halyomorpha halys]